MTATYFVIFKLLSFPNVIHVSYIHENERRRRQISEKGKRMILIFQYSREKRRLVFLVKSQKNTGSENVSVDVYVLISLWLILPK